MCNGRGRPCPHASPTGGDPHLAASLPAPPTRSMRCSARSTRRSPAGRPPARRGQHGGAGRPWPHAGSIPDRGISGTCQIARR